MGTEEMNSWGTKRWVAIAVSAILVFIVAFYMIGGTSTGFSLIQFVGVLIGAAFSGIVTLLLLQGQTDILKQQREGEAQRDKDVKIYSNKIAAFSAFNKAVWTDELAYDNNKSTIVTTIRRELFSKVILYLTAEEIDRITNCVNKYREGKSLPTLLSAIVEELNRNASESLGADVTSGNGSETKYYRESCKKLWESFEDWLSDFAEQSSDSALDMETPAEPAESRDTDAAIEVVKSIKPGIQPWHFCMWNQDEQMRAYNSGIHELSLVEYQEYWRTKLVMEVKKGDIVFSFKGNKKYSGAFIVKGWRVFRYDEARNVTEQTSEGIEPVVVPKGESRTIDSVKETLSRFDFYQSFAAQNSTSCANIVVEPIVDFPTEVQNPNTTYRRTISRYYPGYAVRLLDAFTKAAPESRAKIDEVLV